MSAFKESGGIEYGCDVLLGLNLTGADMVIHYDPWWNASAENQATDRAYRIGQKNNVQVYKLIVKDSIEEKIYELQKNKSQLINALS
jgi:SNF2 family DNA or RNA helicase